MPQRPGKYAQLVTQVGFYAGLGFILPAGAVGGYVLGWALDGQLRTAPVLSIVLAFLGAAAGFVEVLRILARAEKRESGDDRDSKPGEGPGPR